MDEAQNLSIEALEELRMLSNFQVGASAPFQSFLIGQPQFRTLLAHADLEQLRQRIIASYHLGAVGREECGEYLEHRLRCVGWEGDPHFDPEAVDAIYDRTQGIPRKINNLCSRMMLYGFLEELHRFTRADVERGRRGSGRRTHHQQGARAGGAATPDPATAPAPMSSASPRIWKANAPSAGAPEPVAPQPQIQPQLQSPPDAQPSTALAPVDLSVQDISKQLAALDRRIGVQEDFMRRLAVALQLSYSSR